MNERIVCLDIGDARIGVAVSDSSRLIATPIDTIYRVGWGPDVKKIVAICEKYETTLVLSGWPLNMDGTAGFQSEKVKKFCEQLEKAGLTVYYQDERLTTVTAESALLEGNMHRAERKHNVDKVAAAVILQQWLDTQRNAAIQEQTEKQEENTMENNENMEIIELIDENGEASEVQIKSIKAGLKKLRDKDPENEPYVKAIVKRIKAGLKKAEAEEILLEISEKVKEG